jgi:hypothetical protein
MQELGVTAASDREGVRPWFLSQMGEGVLQFA